MRRLFRSAKMIAQRVTWSLPMVPAGVVFVVLTIFSIVMWQWSAQNLRNEQQQEIDKRIAMVQDSIVTRMRTSETMLRAGTGLFDASEDITRNEWRRFFAKLLAEKETADMSAIGYAPVVPATDRDAFEQSMRRDEQANYTVTPRRTTERVIVPVMYAEYLANTTPNRLGYDMFSDVDRRQAMEQARDTNEAIMTQPLHFENNNNEGVVLYMPVYHRGMPINTVTQRRAAIQGYVYATIRVNELFNTIAFEDDQNFGFILYQTQDIDESEIFRSLFVRNRSGVSEPAQTSQLKIFGQQWILAFYTTGHVLPATLSSTPLNVLAGGMAIAFFVSIAVFLSIAYRTRSFALAEERKLQQAKDGLLSLASHQLRTPATGVKQYIGMVLDGFSGEITKDQTALLKQAYLSNERQLQIINEFLYVAKLGSGSLVISRHRFDLRTVVLDLIDEMRSGIDEQQHKLTVKLLKAAPIVADEHSVRMIIENLLSNAIKYTPKRGAITISLKKRGGKYHLSVADTGVGIAEEDMPKLFKQFSRIPNALSHDVVGTGVGLYLAQQLATRNAGEITVTSKPNKGSTFTLSLPANL